VLSFAIHKAVAAYENTRMQDEYFRAANPDDQPMGKWGNHAL
jgi:hypothetical protein